MQAQIASSAYSTLSSDAPVGSNDDDQGRSVVNTFGDLDANLDKVLDVATVRPLLAALPKREQTVLTLRFFENMTQTQIAGQLGISQMHVSRLLARSLAALRQQVRVPEPVEAVVIRGRMTLQYRDPAGLKRRSCDCEHMRPGMTFGATAAG